jgi:hypothetical protein
MKKALTTSIIGIMILVIYQLIIPQLQAPEKVSDPKQKSLMDITDINLGYYQ